MAKKRRTQRGKVDWATAKKRCRLNARTIAMAKELGMSPRALVANIPSRDQRWKAPVHVWIWDLHERRFGPEATPDRRGEPPSETQREHVREVGSSLEPL